MEKLEIKEIPTSPGIYIFKDEYKEPLYVGKAKNLRKRVPSYFRAVSYTHLTLPTTPVV